MKARRLSNQRKDAPAAELRATATEAIDRFARVLRLAGMSREEVFSAFSEACERLPKSRVASAPAFDREMIDAGHVLTLWVSDPNYLDSSGNPLPIPMRGKHLSLEALLQRVNPELSLEQVKNYVIRTGTVVKVGQRYAVKKHHFSFRTNPQLAYTHGLWVVLGVLRTIEHNARPNKVDFDWFESLAENPRFPARLAGEFDAKIRRLGMDFLKRIDADMLRAEQLRQPGEPTVRMTVGLFQSAEEHRFARARPAVRRRKRT